MSRTFYSGVNAQWGAKFLNGIRKELGNSFQVHDEFMNRQGPKSWGLDYGRRHTWLRLTCGSRSGANRES
ncbi:transposase [Pseudomonas sp. IT-P74]